MKPVIRSSIWLRLTIFVGVLVIVTSGILIWTGYAFARDILIDQIQERLTVVTADRQALLLAYIRQQQGRVQLVASRTRLRQLLEAHADGQMDKIITDLLHFRIRKSEKEMLPVLVLVTQVVARHPPPNGIKVNTKITPDLPFVLVDPQQIRQVLTNLVTNAYHAMPEGGELTFSARRQLNELSLLVTDTGKGMSPDVMEQIFEPLFTTKVKGIGLGLSLSKNLVEINGGSISVGSKEGQGSTFTLILPTIPEAAEASD